MANDSDDLNIAVIKEALISAMYGASLDHIAYKSHMPYQKIGRYFSFMVELGLLNYDGEKDSFAITEHAKTFLKRHVAI